MSAGRGRRCGRACPVEARGKMLQFRKTRYHMGFTKDMLQKGFVSPGKGSTKYFAASLICDISKGV